LPSSITLSLSQVDGSANSWVISSSNLSIIQYIFIFCKINHLKKLALNRGIQIFSDEFLFKFWLTKSIIKSIDCFFVFKKKIAEPRGTEQIISITFRIVISTMHCAAASQEQCNNRTACLINRGYQANISTLIISWSKIDFSCCWLITQSRWKL
jgi:hypothetical protein